MGTNLRPVYITLLSRHLSVVEKDEGVGVFDFREISAPGNVIGLVNGNDHSSLEYDIQSKVTLEAALNLPRLMLRRIAADSANIQSKPPSEIPDLKPDLS
jgi:hypothetical protein